MAPKDEELTRSSRDKRSFKTRSKPLLDRRKLQHPESFPLPKKQVAIQVFPAVESFRESIFDKKPLKVFGSRSTSGADKLSSSSKSHGKSWKFKLPLNQTGEYGSSLKSYPEKFMMEVTKVKNKDDNKVSVSVTSSNESGLPNFILCCAPKTSCDTRTRGGDIAKSSREASKQKRKKNSKRSNEEPSSSPKESKDMQKPSNSNYDNKKSFENIAQQPNIGENISEESAGEDSCICHCARCTCSPLRLETQDLEQQEKARDTCDSFDSWSNRNVCMGSDPKMQEEEIDEAMNDETDSHYPEYKSNMDVAMEREEKSLGKKGSRTENEEIGDIEDNEDNEENEMEQTSASDCEEISDELVETDDCQQDSQNGSIQKCACCCAQEAIPNNQEEMQLNSEYNRWLQIQNGNTIFPYPFCCPEGCASYCGCCTCTSMPSLPPEMAPPGNQTIQSSSQKYESRSLGMPSSSTQNNRFNSQSKSNSKSNTKRLLESPNSNSSAQAKQNNSQKASKRQDTRHQSTAEPETPSSGNNQAILSQNRPSPSPDTNNRNTQNNQNLNSQSWVTNNNFDCCPPPAPYYGCNMCPTYQGPWCYPWWYSIPFGYDPCYSPPTAPRNNVASSNNVAASNNRIQTPQSSRQSKPSSSRNK